MTPPVTPDPELEKRLASRLLDVLIRAGVIVAVVILCYRVFSPFLTLTLWAVILAVTVYPLHRTIADKLNGSTRFFRHCRKRPPPAHPPPPRALRQFR